MKFLMTLLLLGSAVFAQETTPLIGQPIGQPPIIGQPLPNDSAFNPFNSTAPKRSFFFLTMNVAESSSDTPCPGVGGGYRYEDGADAIDFSASFSHKKDSFLYNAPKVSYHRFIQPTANNSFYYGGGLAWGGLQQNGKKQKLHHVAGDYTWESWSRKRTYFHGLIPSLNVGYEMHRHRSWRSFMQFDLSQPVLAAYHSGKFPGPFGELCVGLGF